MAEHIASLDKFMGSSTRVLDERYNFHLAAPSCSFKDYVESMRAEIDQEIASKHVVYLDTNAWKCISDFIREKSTLTPQMRSFAQVATSERVRASCVFPIGLSTLFELQSMNDPLTISSLVQIIDNYSQNVCIQSHFDIIQRELELFLASPSIQPARSVRSFCRPMELFGIPKLEFPVAVFSPDHESALQKAMYDVTIGLPVSAHLEMAYADKLDPWDNMAGVNGMNFGKAQHQDRIKSLADGVYVELAGIFSSFLPNEPRIGNFTQPNYYAIEAMLHWKENPSSCHLATARVLSNLHAVMRHTKNRIFKSGDIADFFTAAVALPVCSALFTDHRLVNIVKEGSLETDQFCRCDLVSGFDQFTQYLERHS